MEQDGGINTIDSAIAKALGIDVDSSLHILTRKLTQDVFAKGERMANSQIIDIMIKVDFPNQLAVAQRIKQLLTKDEINPH